MLFDNQIYGLTKSQTSPTTRQGLPTPSHPSGAMIEPINPISFALGAGASFVATTAEWMGNHFVETLDAAFKHPGFSFVHIAQRCPKFNPSAWNFQDSSWLTFLVDEQAGIAADSKSAPDAKVQSYSPQSYEDAMCFFLTARLLSCQKASERKSCQIDKEVEGQIRLKSFKQHRSPQPSRETKESIQ